jgi:S1-C subfamily serine protease
VQGRESKFTTGVVNAETGMLNDVRFFQISAPVQPGNSGGALLDAKGTVVGIVSAKLNAAKTLAATGDIPQNVNYAVKIKYLLAMIDSLPNVRDELVTTHPKAALKSEDIAKLADSATFLVVSTSNPQNQGSVAAQSTPRNDKPALIDTDVMAYVNGKPIYMSQMETMITAMQKQGVKDTPELRSKVREELINRAILMQESERLGLIAKEDIKDPTLSMARQAIGIRTLVANYVVAPAEFICRTSAR